MEYKDKEAYVVIYPAWEDSQDVGLFQAPHVWLPQLILKERYKDWKKDYKYGTKTMFVGTVETCGKWINEHIQYNKDSSKGRIGKLIIK